ncbi:MAG TPA: aminotransferase class III-fold pyridoxal phosphate-dependent enzyme [Burkholderiales bacterium]|nr:aminotransferase class III-fold pyridoxal phosphate-dependent enzyme [Burkholderiales bacterium]
MTTKRNYAKSQALLTRAQRVIPLGSQTFSKSRVVYPENAAPLFLTHGKGSHVWDVDGNEYVDFVNGLLPVILGYDDPDVIAAVTAQLQRGVTFSLATELEIELAELLTEIIPCAEMVRFGKNGSDATSAAVRIARACTGRDRVAVCGYHGWQDWYVGATTRNKGVPAAVGALTEKFAYNDLDALGQLLASHPGEFAAVMMEPMNVEEPREGFLQGVRDLAHDHGALFVFDEIITGFRYHLGGAQTLFEVVPDLATFGKSMGNGFPISAIVGHARYMAQMEEIFFSSTFGGEALSLAASLATIRKMQREPVHATLNAMGERVMNITRANIERHGLADAMTITGKPSWSLMQFRDCRGASASQVKSLFLQEVIARGVLTAGSYNMCYAHRDADLDLLDKAQREACAVVAAALHVGDIDKRLYGAPIEPVFRVR